MAVEMKIKLDEIAFGSEAPKKALVLESENSAYISSRVKLKIGEESIVVDRLRLAEAIRAFGCF